jgi:hypothetical protein
MLSARFLQALGTQHKFIAWSSAQRAKLKDRYESKFIQKYLPYAPCPLRYAIDLFSKILLGRNLWINSMLKIWTSRASAC